MASIISAGTTSGTSLNLSADTSGVLQLATNGTTTAVTIDTSQNVGIGASPSFQLDVVKASASTPQARVQNTTTTAQTISLIAANDAGTSVGMGVFGSAAGTAGMIGAGAPIIGTAATELNIYANNGSGVIKFATGGLTERMRIPAAGGVQSAGSISVGGATPTTSGAGITFPATQSASSDANTLDDYEEGTWTPTFTNISGTSVLDNRYTKVGRLVTVMCRWNWTSGSGSSITVSLPFTAGQSSVASSGSCGSIFWKGPNAGTIGPISIHVSGNSSSFALYKLSGTSFTGINGSDVNASDYELLATFSYFV